MRCVDANPLIQCGGYKQRLSCWVTKTDVTDYNSNMAIVNNIDIVSKSVTYLQEGKFVYKISTRFHTPV